MAEQAQEPQWANFSEIDRLIHEPARLTIMTILSVVRSADFLYLQHESGLTKGNLSAHLSKLEEAGYLDIEKSFNGKVPHTECSLTKLGRQAFDEYLDHMREMLGQE